MTTMPAEISRQCRFIRPLLMVTPPDPTRLNPFAQNRINPWGERNDLDRLLKIGREFGRMGEKQMYEIIRFWTMSIGDFLDEYFENRAGKASRPTSSIIGTALGAVFARHGLCLAASLYGRGRWADRRLGLCPRRHGLGLRKAMASAARRSRCRNPHQCRSGKVIISAAAAPSAWHRPMARRSMPRPWSPMLDPKRTYLKLIEKSDAGCHRSRHPHLRQELQDPRLLRQAEHRARRPAAIRRAAAGERAGAPSISAAISITSSTPSTITNTARWSKRPVPRHRDPDHGRSDHGPAGQAFHVGLRAIRSLQARRERPGRRR